MCWRGKLFSIPLLLQLGIGGGNLEDSAVQRIIDMFDENGDNEMDFMEFIEFFSYICKMLVKKIPKAGYLKYLSKYFSNFTKTFSVTKINFRKNL